MPPAPLPGVDDRSTTAHVEDVEVHLALVDALTSTLGTDEVSVAAIELLRETAAEAVALQAAVDRKTVQYEQVSASLASLREQRAEDRKRLEDEQVEHADLRAPREGARGGQGAPQQAQRRRPSRGRMARRRSVQSQHADLLRLR
ncbi:hypothetical protein [Sanguibacter massiliensis]|uniref:hypothetical protein n=1 Tax=Sanguibacter massiliensis TaxID=1973217 RepID=UPI00101ADE0E|nr:hypothetical protein [Sanguibacter massiliensis]